MKLYSIKTLAQVKNKEIERAFHKDNEFKTYNAFLSNLYKNAKKSGMYSINLTEKGFIKMVNDFNNNTK